MSIVPLRELIVALEEERPVFFTGFVFDTYKARSDLNTIPALYI
jgi:hypothetical protein